MSIYVPNATFSRNIFADKKLGLVDVFSNAYVKNVRCRPNNKNVDKRF